MIKKSIITRKPKILTTINFNLFVLFLIVALMPLTVYLVSQQQDVRQRAKSDGAEFVISPSVEKVSPGQTLALAIDVNTRSNPVNLVEVNITYPNEKLDVSELDTKNSSFDIHTEYIAGHGLIKFTRGVQTPVTGEKHVATIVFNAKQETEAHDVKIIPGSTILRSTDNTNIYSGNVLETKTTPAESIADRFLTANSEFWDYVYTTFFPSIFKVFQEK